MMVVCFSVVVVFLAFQGSATRAMSLALMSGLVQMVVGMLKLGAVFDLVSPPVLTGFVSASAITIATGQLKDLLGLRGIGREFTEAVHGVVENIGDTNGYDATLGVCSMVLVFMFKSAGVRKIRGCGTLSCCVGLCCVVLGCVVLCCVVLGCVHVCMGVGLGWVGLGCVHVCMGVHTASRISFRVMCWVCVGSLG